MVRLSAIYVSFCMVLIAVSIGIALFIGFGLSGPETMIVSVAVLTALALYDAVDKQLRSRSIVSEQIGNLSRGMADLAWQVGDLTRQVGELTRRVGVAEKRSDPAVEEAKAAIPTFAADIDELGIIVQQLAETVAAHENTIAEQQDQASNVAPGFDSAPAPQNSTAGHEYQVPTSVPAVPAAPIAQVPADIKSMNPQQMVSHLRGILDANRADIYLQPIVSLPQRRIRYYEAFTRLRNADGSLVLPADFLAVAERAGLMPRIDHLMLSRAAVIVRRLLSKNRDIGLICNIATKTLTDPLSFQQLLQFFDANQELSSALLLEFPQIFWRAKGPTSRANLAALAKLGVRFSIDRVTDLHFEPRDLAERGIRMVKVPAKTLLSVVDAREFDIHPNDLADLLARFGISLIGEQIEAEDTVADLLDLEVRFGQGFLFSPPRPVRAEVLLATIPDETPVRIPELREEHSPIRTLANAVEEIRRTGALREPTPGGSRA